MPFADPEWHEYMDEVKRQDGCQSRVRTCDHLLNREPLRRLSYPASGWFWQGARESNAASADLESAELPERTLRIQGTLGSPTEVEDEKLADLTRFELAASPWTAGCSGLLSYRSESIVRVSRCAHGILLKRESDLNR